MRSRRAFTLIELLTVIVIVGVLVGILVPVVSAVRRSARQAVSTSNLRQLATSTLTYIAEQRGLFPPAMSFDNNTRWHGARPSLSAPFDPAKGWLGPYLGRDGRVKICPAWAALDLAPDAESFETGAGGYGYNMTYLGGPIPDTPTGPYRPARFATLPQPSRTVMFATTALARSNGLQEYPFAEPPQWLNPGGGLEGESQPSVHFRFSGKALIAWCDGRVSAEMPNAAAWPGPNYYGGDNRKSGIGWFGPVEANGYWNPLFPNTHP